MAAGLEDSENVAPSMSRLPLHQAFSMRACEEGGRLCAMLGKSEGWDFGGAVEGGAVGAVGGGMGEGGGG